MKAGKAAAGRESQPAANRRPECRRSFVVLAISGTLFACGPIRPPKPPQPPTTCPAACPAGTSCSDPAQGCQPISPPGPVCEVGVDQCGCYVMPPGTGVWEEAKCGAGQTCNAERKCVTEAPVCPTCPAGYSCHDPSAGCVKDPPPPSGGCSIDGEPGPVIPNYKPVLGDEVNKSMGALRPDCPVGSHCVVPEGRQEWQAKVVAEMKRRGRCAGQHTPTTDEIAVATSSTAAREGWHVYAGPDTGPGTVVWSPGAARPVYAAPDAPPVEPPLAQGACSDPWPPKVESWGGPKAHLRTNDSTPKFYNRVAHRWDGTEITGYCDSVGFTMSLWCPARFEGDAERGPCEEIGVAGHYGGRPLWRSDGTVELSDNPFQSTCDGCTWLEVCAADGTACSRCSVDQTTGLCEVKP